MGAGYVPLLLYKHVCDMFRRYSKGVTNIIEAPEMCLLGLITLAG